MKGVVPPGPLLQRHAKNVSFDEISDLGTITHKSKPYTHTQITNAREHDATTVAQDASCIWFIDSSAGHHLQNLSQTALFQEFNCASSACPACRRCLSIMRCTSLSLQV